MARKAMINKADLLQTAFVMAKEGGIGQVTARRLAVKAGCSTQPIFRAYKNMEELWEEVFLKAHAYFEDFYETSQQEYQTPFVNLGMAYIEFARVERYLFEILFLSNKRYGKGLYDLINGRLGSVGKEINKAKSKGCRNPEDLFMKMWIFIHGSACMSLTGDYDLSPGETVRLLEESYQSFIN